MTGPEHEGPPPRAPRPVNRPRVADRSNPLPVQPRRELFPNRLRGDRETPADLVVPPSDNPLLGMRAIGILMLSWEQTVRQAGANPILAYFTGRRRGRHLEDFVAILPWFFLFAADVFVFHTFATRPGEAMKYVLLTAVFAMPILPLWGVVATSFHFRRTINAFPLEEIVLTRLTTRDIVYGFALRPAATMAAANAYYLFLAFAVGGVLMAQGIATAPVSGGFLVVVFVLRVILYNLAAESGVAVAIRAQFCIRSPASATTRALFDLLLVGVLLVGIAGVVWIFVLFSAFILASTFLAIFGFALVLVAVFAGISGCAYLISSTSYEALQWTADNPGEWWIRRSADREMNERTGERTLFTPWKPMADLPRAYRARRPSATEFRARRDR